MSRNARDPDVKAWVQKTLPVLEEHLALARKFAATTGAVRGSPKN